MMLFVKRNLEKKNKINIYSTAKNFAQTCTSFCEHRDDLSHLYFHFNQYFAAAICG